MLRIGKLTDYAMLVLSEMAKDPSSVLSATYIAEQLHLMPTTISKVLKILSDASLVTSVRGAEGGYRLARSAGEITVADVIAAMEGNIAMTECCDDTSLCAIDSMCSMKDNWRKINGMVRSLLSQYTVLDMLSPLSLEMTNDK